jgi:hypothetical protein
VELRKFSQDPIEMNETLWMLLEYRF